MEAVSAAKMRKAQQRAIAGRAYARAAVSVLSRVSESGSLSSHPLATVRPVGRALYIVITSDKGLAGALNSAVLRAVLADMTTSAVAAQDVRVIAIGRKANDFFAARGFTVEKYHANTDTVSSVLVHEVVAEAGVRFAAGDVDTVRIAYQNFVSTFEQRPTIRTVFPLSLEELSRVVGDIVPVRGQGSDVAPEAPLRAPHSVEPSEEAVLGAIVPRLAGIFVYHALLETQASEHSARMVAMKSASDKAGEMQDALTRTYNKARQAAITREVSEIIGGMEAVAI